MKNGKKKKELPEEISLNGGSFGMSLSALLGKNTEKKEVKNTVSPAVSKSENTVHKAKLQRYSLQRQTAGRGGKVVTLVVFPQDSAFGLEALAKEMRKALGCGAHVEENKVVLQGDLTERAEKWLEKRRQQNE